MAASTERGLGAAGAIVRRVALPLAAIAAAVAIFGLPHLRQIESTQAVAYVADPMQCELKVAPRWFGGDVETRLREALAALPPQTLRDDAAVDAYADRLARSSGWIQSVDRAAKLYPNRLEIEVTLRKPVALIEARSGLELVDVDGVVIAPACEASNYLATHELPVVHSVRPLDDGVAGVALRDQTVLGGLAVAAEIAPFRETLREHELTIAIIDVSVAGHGPGTELSEVDLLTAKGLALEWGRARSRGRLGILESEPDVKIRRLLTVAAKYPGMAGIRRIRLQFAPPTVLAEDPNGPEHSLVSRIGEGH